MGGGTPTNNTQTGVIWLGGDSTSGTPVTKQGNGTGGQTGDPYNYYGGYGGYGGTSPDNEDLWYKSLALDKANDVADAKSLNSNLDRLTQANKAVQKIARSQERAAKLEANSDFFNREKKLQLAEQAVQNAATQSPWTSTGLARLTDLVATMRDLDTNEVLTTKRNSLTDIYNNEYNALVTNNINAQKAIAEYINAERKRRTGMIGIADQYEQGDKFYKGSGAKQKVSAGKKSELGYIYDAITEAAKLNKQWSRMPSLQTVGLTRPDGANRANSNPLVPRNNNTNSNNRAGSVANKNTENFYNALHAGYDSRDKNMSRTQIETGR